MASSRVSPCTYEALGLGMEPTLNVFDLRLTTGHNQFRADIGRCRGRPMLPPHVQGQPACVGELANQAGKPPCNCRSLIKSCNQVVGI